ncbi:sigma 54-interacting transcriptional regulator [Psychrobacillus sp. NPDC093180]|uniref:sigma 54-interacting transcriptional regulator n=1 Tax=Psychrobacillus sp. NPDC093180 TaxID=3364489 RepID=UPI003830D6B8
MLMQDVMTKVFPICRNTDTIQQALENFALTKLHIIPVVLSNGQFCGILTKNRLIQALASGYVFEHSISSFIIEKPICLSPENTIPETRTILLENQIGHAPVLNDKKEPVGIMSTSEILYLYDKVYDRMETELELIFQNLNFGLFSVDKNLNIISINPMAHLFLQLSSDNYTFGKREIDEPILTLLNGILLNQETGTKTKLQLNNHSLYVKCYPILENNELVGSMVLMEDMTMLEETVKELEFSKEWEDKLRSVVELAYDGIILVDEQLKITMANKGFCDLYEMDEKALLGNSIIKTFPELDIEETLRMGVKMINVPKLIRDTQSLITVLPIKDGEVIVGAICKITYQGLTQLQTALQKVSKLEQQLSYYQNELKEIRGTKYSLADIVGESESIRQAKKEALAASRSRSTVLLLGESGTGKELFAHGIHAASQQTGMFVQVNCAAIPSELLESEFFGYAEGSFTGAKKGGKKGKLEMAQNGTLFLDEIGDMPLQLQTKLLRVLQEKEFEPVGSNRIIQLDTKIIAATNKNLEKLISEGKFREDLYYRLNIMRIEIPPLRERMEDIPDIVNSIITELNRSGFQLSGITHSALTRLLNYDWPGNIRELQNLLERAANLTQDHYIKVVQLPNPLSTRVQQNTDEHVRPFPSPKTLSQDSFISSMERTEKELILTALREANGNKAQASRSLGISRTWLYAKMKKYQLT